MSSSDNLEWKFSQTFGETRTVVDDSTDADVVSALEFSENGDFLAVGDRGGRIVLFEREEKSSKVSEEIFPQF